MQSQSTVTRTSEAPLPSSPIELEPSEVRRPPHQSFAHTTVVRTANGMARVDTLSVGQYVLTRSGKFEPITGIDHIHLSKRTLQDDPDLAPVRFDPGALPGMSDDTATLLSPDCPITWTDDPQGVSRYTARAFCDGGLIRTVIPEEGVHYVRLHFATEQEVCAGNIWVVLSTQDDNVINMTRHAPKVVHEIRIFRPLRA